MGVEQYFWRLGPPSLSKARHTRGVQNPVDGKYFSPGGRYLLMNSETFTMTIQLLVPKCGAAKFKFYLPQNLNF